MTVLVDPAATFPALFEQVGLDHRLRKAVARLGHVRPTLVQSKTIPLAIASGRDLLVRARTGSGKTLSYALPTLHKLLIRQGGDKLGVGAIILVPTRELCAQVYQTLRALCYYADDVLSIAVLSVGNHKKDAQERERQEAMLRDQPDVIVATPGGLLTQIRRKTLPSQLRESVQTLVVDEADLVLSFGYSNDIAEIVKALPKIFQGFLMSATLSPEIDNLKKIMLHSPVVLKLEQEEEEQQHNPNEQGKLKQFYLALPKKDKKLVLYVFLKLGLLKGKGLFFVNSTDAGYRLKLFLEQFHIRSSVLNAELPFQSRLNIIEQFNVGNFDYLIATDASTDAAEQDSSKQQHAEYGVSRGLDFRNVSFVVNVDFPPNARSYTHRVGRTARGGARGVALSLVEVESREQQDTLFKVQEDQPKIKLSKASTDKLQARPMEGSDGIGSPDQAQPVPLDFDLQEIEGFRYRVEDVARAVTKTAVRETRAAELKAEILNSERLQNHFEENPADLQLLAHDRVVTHGSRVQEHLKHVPKYLLPRGMQVATLNRKRKKKKVKGRTDGQRRSDNDPLQSFDGDVNLDDVQDDDDEDADDEFMEEGENASKKQKVNEEPKVFTNTKDGTGKSTSGRNTWKAKHKKGQFSGKKRMSERRTKQPLGI